MTAATTTIVSSGEFSPSSWVLLNKYAQVGENSNETTVHCQVSNDLKIYASLARECPPLPSNLYVYCSGATFAEPPSSLSMVDDLILFHVYTGPPFRSRSGLPSYFFLYRADPKRPSLKLLPHPQGLVRKYHPFGIFPRGRDHYTVASLIPLQYDDTLFALSMYDSETNAWSFKKLSVASPQKDFPVAIPDAYCPLFHHHTSTVLTLGGTIGWVDLWRGILFSDMLSGKHTLSGVPLPLPFKFMEEDIGLGSARSHRGIGFISGHLRLVEVCLKVEANVPGEETVWPCPRIENWTITTWTNKEMSNSYDDWHMNCTFQASDIFLGDHSESDLPAICRTFLFLIPLLA
jgi:hypothetical protein